MTNSPPDRTHEPYSGFTAELAKTPPASDQERKQRAQEADRKFAAAFLRGWNHGTGQGDQ